MSEVDLYRSRIDDFRFESEENYIFACQAAVPLVLTPDLLYQLWNNFKQYSYENETEMHKISHLAVSDLLVSGLCRLVGVEIYEIDKPLRDILLEDLVDNLGEKRKNTIAAFLEDYALREHRYAQRKNLRDIHLLTAQSILDPSVMEQQIVERINNTKTDAEKINLLMLHQSLIPLGYGSDLWKISKEVTQFESGKNLRPVLVWENNPDAAGVLNIEIKLPDNISIVRESYEQVATKTESPLDLINKSLSTKNPILDLQDFFLGDEELQPGNSISDQLAKCEHLTSLEIRGHSGLSKFPQILLAFKKLVVLRLGGNENESSSIQNIPPQIIELQSLELLDLSRNALVEIPEEIGYLIKLKKLKVNGNYLSKLPSSLGNLKNLLELNLNNNNIEKLPSSFVNLTRLKKFWFENNPFAKIIHDREGISISELINKILSQQVEEVPTHKVEDSYTGFKYDIFIAYTSDSRSLNVKEHSWISQFIDMLQQHLIRRTGHPQLKIFFDKKIGFGENFNETIQDAVRNSAVLIFLNSANYVNSVYGKVIFSQFIQASNSSLLDKSMEGRSRIFNVRVDNTPSRYWPEEIRRMTGYVFFDDSNEFLEPDSERFIKKIMELSQDIGWILRKLKDSNSEIVVTNERLNHNLPLIQVQSDLTERLKMIVDAITTDVDLLEIVGARHTGKTDLALQAGYFCLNAINLETQSAYFDFIVWIDTKIYRPENQQLKNVLNKILEVLNYKREIIADDLESNKKIVEELLSIHKVLLIVDNLERIPDPEFLSWIQELPDPSKAIVTSRQKTFLYSRVIDMDYMTEKESINFITSAIADQNIVHLSSIKDEELLMIADSCQYNSAQITAVLKLVKLTAFNYLQFLNDKEKVIDNEHLLNVAWQKLADQTKLVGISTSLFAGETNYEALAYMTKRNSETLDKELNNLSENGFGFLIEFKNMEISNFVRQCIRKKHAEVKISPDLYYRMAMFYNEFIDLHLSRETPSEPYWDTLVTNSMEPVDKEWENIAELLIGIQFHSNHTLILRLVMLLSHYMDNRLLTHERIYFAKLGVEAASKMDLKYEEALLRINFLGRNYFEAMDYDNAINQIESGLLIVLQLRNTKYHYLEILGNTLLNQIKFENGDITNPAGLFEIISNYIRSDASVPWIFTRILMVAGDIQFRLNKFNEAYRFYTEAFRKLKEYGEEGDNYQLIARLGLTFLAKGDLQEAENLFGNLTNSKAGPFGLLIGNYGYAIVKMKQRDDYGFMLMTEILEHLFKIGNFDFCLRLMFWYDSHHLSMETDSLKEPINQGIQFFAGKWHGFYIQATRETDFTLTLRVGGDNRIYGSTTEGGILGDAYIAGTIDLKTKKIMFHKRYVSTIYNNYTVLYTGIWDNTMKIKGIWEVGSQSGSFEMTKEEPA